MFMKQLFLVLILVYSTISLSWSETVSSQLSGLRSLTGIWLQRGYARLVVITEQGLTNYDVTKISCVPVGKSLFTPAVKIPFEEVAATYDRVERHSDKHFSWYEKNNFTRYDFDRIEKLPDQCLSKPARSPLHTFEAFWHLFKENYAFFELRGVDWDQMYKTHRPLVHAHISDDDLFAVLSDMIKPLNDGHVFIFDGAKRGLLSGSLGEVWERWANDNPDLANKGQMGADPRAEFISYYRDYVANEILEGQGHRGANDTIFWGWVSPDIGYIDIHSMAMTIADNPDPSVSEVVTIVKKTMDKILMELGHAKAIIIDARFNSGGKDIMGFTIAGYFTDKERLVSRKRALHQGNWTETQDIYIHPQSSRPFTGPVYYLAGKNSISAAETFSLAMQTLPNVKSVGTNTYGVLSDILFKVLPNGWFAGLSNEIYESADGKVYEGSGVPADIAIPLSVCGKLDLALKKQLDTVIALAEGNAENR